MRFGLQRRSLCNSHYQTVGQLFTLSHWNAFENRASKQDERINDQQDNKNSNDFRHSFIEDNDIDDNTNCKEKYKNGSSLSRSQQKPHSAANYLVVCLQSH